MGSIDGYVFTTYIANVFSFYNHNDMDMNGADVMRVLIVLLIIPLIYIAHNVTIM